MKTISCTVRGALATLLVIAGLAPVHALAQVTPPNLTMPFPVWHKGVVAVPASTTGTTYYVDGTNGNDANAGTGPGPTAAFRTIAKATSKVAAGDTVLIRKGFYREGINAQTTGTSAKPITYGSYGDGEVILDGSKAVTGWVNQGGTVWKAPVSFTPIGVVVNEVPLKQVRQGQGGSTAPQEGVAGVTSGSGKWFVGGGSITADFGPVLGGGDPNAADIIVPDNNGSAQHVFWFDVSYITFKGLTIRGNGSNGLWGYGGHITVDSCDIKFNGKAAVSFLSQNGTPNSDNAVLMSHAYHNNLINWPRGNNHFAEDGGGWPGTLVWDTNLRPLARGNVVHMNGGEGIITYGTDASLPSGSALFEQNVAFDNWSVNMYFDNQPNDVARQNFLFNHPPDDSNFLYAGGSGAYSNLEKFTVCLMLADEQNSSDATNNHANLSGTQVYDNVLAGCRISIRDYSEGTAAIAHHGLKNTVIANNTIIMPFNTFINTETYGFYLQDNGGNNSGSIIENNIVYGFNTDPVFASEASGAISGITVDYNDYFSAASKPFLAGSSTVNFTGWKAAMTGMDTHSLFADPLLVNITALRGTAAPVYDFNNARLTGPSPAVAAGIAGSGIPAADFMGIARPNPPSIGAFEPSFFTTTTSLASSFNPSTTGQAVTFTATVSSTSATGTVSFLDGVIPLCASAAVASGVATCTTSALSAASHSITAIYSGDGTFGTSTSLPVVQVVTARPTSVGKVDFNGDGNADLVFEDTDGGVEVWLMQGTTVLDSRKIVPSAPGHIMGSTGDFNGDGKADLLFQRSDGSVEMWLMNGTTVLSTTLIMPVSHGWSVAGTGDFDADGKSDILWKNADGTVGLWLMNGSTIKLRTSIIGAGAVSTPTNVGDFNGDGKADILWRSTYDGTAYMWVMNGLTAVDRGTVFAGPNSWTALRVADFNHDGRSDIVWQNTDGTVSVWTMNGRTIVTHGPVLGANSLWTVTHTGDLNGDGNADLFWLSRDGTVGTWLMNGLTILSKKTQRTAGSGWSVSVVEDVNNDGMADIVWTSTTGEVDLWLMNGLDSTAVMPLLPAGSTQRVINVRFHQ